MYSFVNGGAVRSTALVFCVRRLTEPLVPDLCSEGRGAISGSSGIGGGMGEYWVFADEPEPVDETDAPRDNEEPDDVNEGAAFGGYGPGGGGGP